MKYTITEAKDYISKLEMSPDAVIYHILTNDIKQKGASNCLEEMTDLIVETEKKLPNAKIVISTATHRLDNEKLNLRISSLNAQIMEFCDGKENLSVVDNDNLVFNGKPQRKFLKDDGYHLSYEGTKMLASNMRRGLESVFELARVYNTGRTLSQERRNSQKGEKHYRAYNNRYNQWRDPMGGSGRYRERSNSPYFDRSYRPRY